MYAGIGGAEYEAVPDAKIYQWSLLARSDGGIIFLPGAAGTVQENFQDACENYYAGAEAAEACGR